MNNEYSKGERSELVEMTEVLKHKLLFTAVIVLEIVTTQSSSSLCIVLCKTKRKKEFLVLRWSGTLIRYGPIMGIY